MRDVQKILLFRSDISPFLVHLTRAHDGFPSAQLALKSILTSKKLLRGSAPVSDVRYGGVTSSMSDDEKKRFFAAVSFTETPLNEIHTLLEIAYRNINLEPWGLVFLRTSLQKKGVSPVIHINNERGESDQVMSALFALKDDNAAAAEKFLPLVSVFGQKIRPPGAPAPVGRVDWLWEREWRFPHSEGDLNFEIGDVFVGLCPHPDIDEMEDLCGALFPNLSFVDPTRNMKWYADKLLMARQRLNLKVSVV